MKPIRENVNADSGTAASGSGSKRKDRTANANNKKTGGQSILLISVLLIASFSVVLTVNPSIDLDLGLGDGYDEEDDGNVTKPEYIANSGVTSADVFGDDVIVGDGKYRLAYNRINSTDVELYGWDSNPGYSQPSGEVVIPSTVEDNGNVYNVTSTAGGAIYNYPYYAEGVFAGCTTITSVVLPSTLKTIGLAAFFQCTGMTSINLENVTTITDCAFLNCTGLAAIDLTGATTVMGNAFAYCAALTTVALPASITSIDSSTFEYCTSLTTINLDNVVDIGYGAFRGCSSLADVTLPAAVTTINTEAFEGCSSLTAINLDNVIVIGNYAFQNSGITGHLVIPASVTTINTGAFSGCNSLVSVYIPSTVTSLSLTAFTSSSSFQSYIVDPLHADYTSRDGVLFDKPGTTLLKFPSGRAGEYTVPADVTAVAASAFANCELITGVDLANITSLGARAFYYCYGLESIVIPAGIDTIEEYTFNRCSSLVSVDLGNVVTIKGYAFQSCWVLPSLVLPDTVKSVGNYAFNYCNVLENLDLGQVETIGNSAFMGCGKLTEVTIPSTVTSIGSSAFRSLASISNIFFEGDSLPSTMSATSFSDLQFFYSHGVKAASWWEGNGYTFLEAKRGAYYELTLTPNAGELVFQGFTAVKVPSSTNNYLDPVPITQAWTEQYIPADTKLLYSLDSGVTWAVLEGTVLTADTTGLGRIAFTLTFDVNNGTGTTPAPIIESGNVTLADGSGLSRSNYYLSGWNTEPDGNGTHYDLGAVYNISGNVTLYAEWSQYTITFNPNSATSGTQAAQAGYGSVALPDSSSLLRNNFYLSGWNTQADGLGTHYDLGGMFNLTGDVTLFAEWSQYTISYDVNNATTGSDFTQTGAGSVSLDSDAGILRSNYYLSGWNTQADGQGVHYDLGGLFSLTGDTVLFAEWSQYTITYNANSATAGTDFTQSGYGSVALDGGSSLARTNHYLAGWNTLPSGLGTHYDLGSAFVLTTDVILYAEWKQYSVSYDNNTGSGSIPSHAGVDVTLSAGAAFSKPGYTLTGWNTLANGTGTSYNLSETLILTKDLSLYAVWTADPVTVTYHGNGGTGTPASSTGVTDGAWSLPSAADYTRPGYTLSGWAIVNGGPVVYVPGQSATFVHTISNVYAVWTADPMTVTFNGNGGTGTPVSVSGVTGGIFALPSAAEYTRNGYVLIGWDTSSAGLTVVYNEGASTVFKYGETALYAVWQADPMTVTYHGNGGTGPTASSGYTGGSYTVPTEVQYTRGGYTLAGWSIDDDGVVDYFPGTTQTFTYGINYLYAVWTADPMTVNYHGNGGTGSPASVAGVTGGTWTLPSTSDYTRPGYTLTGWSTVVNGSVVYTPGQVTSFAYGISDVYAVWEGNPITVNYDANGGVGTPASVSGVVGGAWTLPSASDYTKQGYTLLGWDSNPAASTVVYQPGDITTFDVAVTNVYAVWSGNSHIVTYHGNGGTGPISSSGNVGGAWTLPTAVQYTRSGYTLAGWDTDPSGASVVYAPGQVTVFDVSVTNVYAVWTADPVTVTYHGNGGTGTPASSTGVTDGAWTLPSAADYTRPGYTLAGWSTTLNGAIIYTQGQSATFDHNVTDVYAVWTADPITVTYDPMGGTGAPASSSGSTGGSWTLPTAAEYTKPGYTLVGWDTSPAATMVVYSPGMATTFKYDQTTVYAVWSPDSMTVNYHGNGGTGSPSSAVGNTGGEWTMPSATDYTRAGYVLRGWDTDPSGSTIVYIEGSTQTFTYGVNDVYAVWEIDTSMTYSVNTVAGQNGTVSADNDSPQGGDDVIVTIRPQSGYLIDTANDNAADIYGLLTEVGDGSWTYKINSIIDNHTIEVTFKVDTSAVHTISGTVNPNAGTDEGFTVTLNGVTVTTGPGGSFSFNVPGGFTGSISVSKNGYVTESYGLTNVTAADTSVVIGISIIVYNVTFNAPDADGGSWPVSIPADHGYPISSLPVDPVRSGFEFAGWYIMGTKFDPLTLITQNTVLTAEWLYICTVIIDVNGTSGCTIQVDTGNGFEEYTGPLSVCEGTDVYVRAVAPDGMRFAGWSGHVTSDEEHIGFTASTDAALTALFEVDPAFADLLDGNTPWWIPILLLIFLLLTVLAIFLWYRSREEEEQGAA